MNIDKISRQPRAKAVRITFRYFRRKRASGFTDKQPRRDLNNISHKSGVSNLIKNANDKRQEPAVYKPAYKLQSCYKIKG